MKYISTSAVALSLLVAAAPFAAFAEDSHVSGSGSGSAQVQTAPPSNGNPSTDGLPMVNGYLHSIFNHQGTSTPPYHRGENQLGGMPGDRMMGNGDSTASSSEGDQVRQGGGFRSGIVKGPHRSDGAAMGDGSKARSAGDAEIDSRVAKLQALITRIGGAERLTADEKTSITALLNTQIASLTSLKAKIDTEGTTTLKTDVGSITKDFRVYALVLPKTSITAAADRIMTIASQMESFSTKISARIDTAAATGTDVSTAKTAFTGYQMKVADAKVQAQAAIDGVASLAPDNGDQTLLQSNTAALKAAKVRLDAAQADLMAARKDIGVILTVIRGKGEMKPQASGSVKVNAHVNTGNADATVNTSAGANAQ